MLYASLIMLGYAVFHNSLFFATGMSGETNINQHPRQPVNFIGSLSTFQGNHYHNIDNISIDNKYANIMVVDKPSAALLPPAKKNELTGVMEVKLTQDPYKAYTDTHLDLKETKKITAIPEVVYVYKPEGKQHGVECIEINVYSNDTQQTVRHHLISRKTKVHFSEINEAGPIEKDAPISAIKELIIKEFRDQKDTKTK